MSFKSTGHNNCNDYRTYEMQKPLYNAFHYCEQLKTAKLLDEETAKST